MTISSNLFCSVSNPTSPVFVSQSFCQGWGVGIDVAGNYAYLAHGYSGLQIIDVSLPSSPTLAGPVTWEVGDYPDSQDDYSVTGVSWYEASVNSLEKAPKNRRFLSAHYMLAQAYPETGRLGEAIAELENHLYNYYMPSPIWIVKSYYYLGLAYERSAWNTEAIEKYEEFLEIWKDADLGIAEIEDARERLMRLEKES